MKVKVKRICRQCGQEFKGNVRALYCCNAHRQAAYRERLRDRNVTK